MAKRINHRCNECNHRHRACQDTCFEKMLIDVANRYIDDMEREAKLRDVMTTPNLYYMSKHKTEMLNRYRAV